MKNKKQRIKAFLLGISGLLLLSGCSQGTHSNPPTVVKEKDSIGVDFIVPGPDSYDSQDTAVLVKKNTEEGTITFLNLEKNRTYTLSVLGTTTIYDKYGEALALDQVKEGEVVDITFLKDKKRLNSLSLSPLAWSNEDISRYEINPTRKTITIGSEVFQLNDNTLFFSLGKQVELMDLNPVDHLTVKGMGSNVLSISVTKGHGYLRLKNDTQFEGGFIEIGSSIIHVITEDMLLTVPEGNYQVTISHSLGGGKKNVSITRNKEVELDIGDLQIEAPKEGMVIFSMSPSDATLYVDGDKVDTSTAVTLPYGIHQIIARADGYATLTSYIKVASESGGIDVTLDKLEQEEEDHTNGYKMFVDGPEGVEVFLDGNYIGIAPISTKKTGGVHTITLRKPGYVTRSYTVNVDTDAKDINYAFAELEEEKSGTTTEPETESTESTEESLETETTEEVTQPSETENSTPRTEP